jgi:predicted O-methyltransferase YrrM
MPLFKYPRLPKPLRKLKVSLRNRRDAVSPVSQVAWLRNYRPAQTPQSEIIRAAHEEYTTTISSTVAAVSLETAYLLWFMLEKIRPALAMDLGSGFSSYLLRLYQSQAVKTGGGCQIISCDDNPEWLSRTETYLIKKGLPASGLLLWDTFCSELGHLRPDLIFHDLGNPQLRISGLPRVLEMCGPRTCLIVDDIHKEPIRAAVLKQVQQRQLLCFDLIQYTYDRFGRYSWLVAQNPDLSQEQPEVDKLNQT